MTQGQFGLYIHWPFCLSKCPYCDFNVYTSDPGDTDIWARAYIRSLETYAEKFSGQTRLLKTIYFGGGTPSMMPPDLIARIIEKALEHWNSAPDLEITLEANPTSVEIEKFEDFKAAGIHRMSLGVQSLYDQDLQFLGRRHGRDDVLKALRSIHEHFERMSFDLIYDRPGQSLADWRAELEEALPYAKGHISAYQLTIEPGTAFEKQVQRGGFKMSDDQHSADLFEMTQDILGEAEIPAYEASNYASEGQESRHNLVYWHYDDYIGIGPGAHGRVSLGGRKYETLDTQKPTAWLKHVEAQGHGAETFKPIAAHDVFDEAFVMGMRLYKGRDLKAVEEISGVALEDKLNFDVLARFEKEGFLEYSASAKHLRYTRKGVMCSNALDAGLLL